MIREIKEIMEIFIYILVNHKDKNKNDGLIHQLIPKNTDPYYK